MGRAAARPPVGGCWMVEDLGNEVVMRCAGNITQKVAKRPIKTPQEMVSGGLYKRQRCDTSCSATPSWKRGDSVNNMPIEEVGYGRPFRWEMARMVAGMFIQLLKIPLPIIILGTPDLDLDPILAHEDLV